MTGFLDVLFSNAWPPILAQANAGGAGNAGAEVPSGAPGQGTPALDLPVWLSDWLNEYLATRWEQAGAILVATFVLAFVVDFIIVRVVKRWCQRTSSQLDDRFVRAFHRPIYIGVVVIGLVLTTVRLQLPDRMEKVTISCLWTIAIFAGLTFAMRACRIFLEVLSHHRDRFHLVQTRTLPIFANLSNVVLLGGGIYLFLVAWNINVTGWLASAGILGLALSFAAKDTLANFFAGVFILADAPYKVGDFIVLDSGERGRVTNIGLRSTRLLTRDDIEITVPNAVLGNTKIVNETGGPHEKERIRIAVGVAYGSDLDQVREALLEIAASHEEICLDPAPRVRFRNFGESSLDHELLCWVDEPVLRGRLINELNTEIYKRFNKDGIEFPYPKRDVYVRELPAKPE